MKTNEFTPKESLELIDQVIQQAKNRFEETVLHLSFGERLSLYVVLHKHI